MTPKQKWKRAYRLLRIARREALEASLDCLAFGTGIVEIDNNGNAMRIPPEVYTPEFTADELHD